VHWGRFQYLVSPVARMHWGGSGGAIYKMREGERASDWKSETLAKIAELHFVFTRVGS